MPSYYIHNSTYYTIKQIKNQRIQIIDENILFQKKKKKSKCHPEQHIKPIDNFVLLG